MSAANDNASGLAGEVVTTEESGYKKNLTTLRQEIAARIWLTAYTTEESRQAHAAAGNKWRQAGCSIAILFFRMIGGVI
jgi:hypothetical protein